MEYLLLKKYIPSALIHVKENRVAGHINRQAVWPTYFITEARQQSFHVFLFLRLFGMRP